MSLLLQPPRQNDEGPAGYRFRLASSNRITVRQLADFEHCGVLDEDGGSFDQVSENGDLDGLSVWVRRWSRFCPGCIAATPHWQLSWEVLFADACARCGLWLVDICSRCKTRLDWRRDALHRCVCGQILETEPGRLAPTSVARLSRALISIAQGQPPLDLALLSGLSLEQSVRLVRLMGAYGTWDGRSAPQKIPNIDRLEVSWTISSYAAEVLCNWPEGMTSLLERLRQVGRGDDTGRLGKTFGGFYTALYNAFGAPEFAFLRTAFEGYVAEHWTGSVAKRNRRLDATVLEAMAWVPANHACRELQVSRRRLAQLVDEGRLRGERRRSLTGREFLMVNRADIIKNGPALDGGVTLTDVAARLGLKRQRLSGLLPMICPAAEKIGALGCPWSVPAAWVAHWEQLLGAQRSLDPVGQSCVSLDHLLRYWPWTDDQVGQLLVDIAEGRLVPRGVRPSQAGRKGIGALLLGIDDARQWFAERQGGQWGEITLPAAAVRLEVKQEVVYALVRTGLLVAVARRAGRRAEWRVSRAALQQFQHRYVFGRDVALMLGRSARAVAAFLASEAVTPVAGPGVDRCRQLVFLRVAVDECLRRTGLPAASKLERPSTPLKTTGLQATSGEKTFTGSRHDGEAQVHCDN